MITGKARVSAKGWVVIPKAIRDEMGIKPGDEVEVVLSEDGKELYARKALTRSELVKALRGKYKVPGQSSALDDLMEEKRKERERDEQRIGPPLRKNPTTRRRKAS